MSKGLKQLIKEIQFKTDLTLDEIAEKVGLSAAYFRNEVSKGTSKSVLDKVQSKFNTIIEQNAQEDISVSGDLNTVIGEMQERLLRAEAYLEVYESAIAGLQSEKGTDYPKKVNDLREQVRAAVNRRLDELRKKQQHGV